ncbi:PIG-L family deacetylase [Litoribacter alkaliphilus]|uniref:PIG-L family deacetylase n=1 Tax=Litoribacter ruber TaxID=702568 RepID=A0AAP2G5I3_9BACT|nr:PIG-L family deacetylase [Litoribacter alkaliphilus]MBS9524573.1 PIG-L family deacetylase [Litoribacter alkaliphilus]
MRTSVLAILLCLIFLPKSYSQHRNRTSSEIYHELLKLKETKRVLYVAAHPDDENTRLISYLANEKHAQIAYLSLTRGDGGQNLIGKELGLELGMIRTQELLQARKVDGGRQFFTRAIDFGFSKNPDETFNNWDKETILSDVVWVIRNYKPDIIITRFNTEPGGTHGHHTSSAILAGEAFKIAGDSTKFPEQLLHTSAWQPKRIFWNAYNWGGEYEPDGDKKYHTFPVGDYNSVLGRTYSQIAAASRTMHKSQGFGATAQIGAGTDYIQLVDGPKFTNDPFETVKNRWEGIPNGQIMESKISEAIDAFDFVNLGANLENLLEIRRSLNLETGNEDWLIEKRKAIDEIIFDILGLTAEFNADEELSFPGKEIKSTLVFNSPSNTDIRLQSYTILDKKLELEESVEKNKPFKKDIKITLPLEYPVSQPYWLEEEILDNVFSISNQKSIGQAFNKPSLSGLLAFELQGQHFQYELPLMYKFNDQVDGETKQPFTITPEVVVHVGAKNVFLKKGKETQVEVEIGFFEDVISGKLTLDGLNPGQYKILHNRTDEVKKKKFFSIAIGELPTGTEKLDVVAKYTLEDGREFDQDIIRIKYKHIPNLTYFPKSRFNILNLNLQLSDQHIGYIPGAGDDIPEVLQQMGYQVTLLDNGSLTSNNLKQYSTIITGIRAFNVNENLANNMDQLLSYVKDGGNMIVQYNTSSPLLTNQLGPYPIKLSRDRVSVEEAPVKFDGDSRILTYPHRISESDFENWVQERGLYFAGEWDSKYQTPFTMNDPGESPKKGSLLYTDHGNGTFAYSGISWFRLLPAGVPGAIKLFVNLIEQTQDGQD